jgi:transcriptional antiterminator NusG
MIKNWYAVYTKPHCEIKVAALLIKKKIENYCPLNRIVTTQANKNKMVYEPLFPSFVFVHALDNEMDAVRQAGSVVNFVFWLGKPVVIKEAEIENIKYFTNQYCNIKLEKTLVSNNNFRIMNNPHIEINSSIISIKDSNFRILLPSLGYTLIAEFQKSTEDAPNYDFKRNSMVS